MTNAKKNNERIDEAILWEDYYSSMHRAYDAMLNVLNRRVQEEGLSSEDLAKRLGVDKALISRRLNGRENLTLRTLSNMASAMSSELLVDFKPREDFEKSNYPNPYIELNKNSYPTSATKTDFSINQAN